MVKLKIGQIKNEEAKKTPSLVAQYYEDATASMRRWQSFVACKAMPSEADLRGLFGNDDDFIMSFKGVFSPCLRLIRMGVAAAYASYMLLTHMHDLEPCQLNSMCMSACKCLRMPVDACG